MTQKKKKILFPYSLYIFSLLIEYRKEELHHVIFYNLNQHLIVKMEPNDFILQATYWSYWHNSFC